MRKNAQIASKYKENKVSRSEMRSETSLKRKIYEKHSKITTKCSLRSGQSVVLVHQRKPNDWLVLLRFPAKTTYTHGQETWPETRNA